MAHASTHATSGFSRRRTLLRRGFIARALTAHILPACVFAIGLIGVTANALVHGGADRERVVSELDEPAYRAKQIWEGIYKHFWNEPEQFSPLSKHFNY